MIGKPHVEHPPGIAHSCSRDRNFSIRFYRLFGLSSDLRSEVDPAIALSSAEDGNFCEFSQRLWPLQISELRWNSLISGYAKHADPGCLLSLYHRLREDSFYPSGYAIVTLLKACAKLKAHGTGNEIHSHLVIQGSLGGNPFIGTALVDMYGKCGMISEAEDVFHRLPHRSTVSWNALIAGYVRCELCKKAVHCFLEMKQQGASPDAVTYACIFKALSQMESSDIGAAIEGSIHGMCAEVERKGILYGNAVVGTCLVEMYVRWGMLEKAREVFDKLPTRNVVVWTSLIGGYVQCDCCEEALTCFEQMLREGVDPDAAALACALKGCASIGAIAKGSEIHAYIDRKGNWKSNLIIGTSLVDMYAKCGALAKATSVFYELCVHDVVSWNALIGGYAVHDCWEEKALCSLQRMKLEGVSPNAITYSCGLKTCGAVGAIKKGAEIHCEIEQSELPKTNQFVGNALIDMYMKCGMLAKALSVFNNLPVRNIVSWNTLITGYAQMGDLENASYMINRMNEQSIEPDQVTFVSLLNACSHAGLVDHGKSCFVMMSRDYGIVPRVEQHTAIVDLLGRAGQLEMAIEMIHKASSHPDIVMWLAVLSACQKWGSLELGKKVFDEAAGSAENDAATLCNMFARFNVD